ncbi:MAG: TolC family protein [Bacteroidetes bacterium]|nr:MAG: TolC family protein [Bacteroidota bacterium]
MRFTNLFFLFFFIIQNVFAQPRQQIKKSIYLAIERNLQLKNREFGLKIIEKEIDKSKIRPNPVFNAQILMLGRTKDFPDKTPVLSPYNRQDWLQVTKRLQIAGQRKSKIEVAKQSFNNRESENQEYVRDLILEVASSWLEVWNAQVDKNLADEAVESLKDLLRRKSFAEGSMESLRFKILDDQYDLYYAKANQTHENQLEELRYLTGSNDSISIDFNDGFFADTLITNEDSLFSIALKNRPDMLISKYATKLARSNIDLQNSLAYPTPEVGLIANPQNTIPYFGLFYTQPLPFFDVNKAEKQKSKLQLAASEVIENDVINKIKSEIRIAAETYKVQKNNRIRVARMLADADKLVTKVRNQFVSGKDSEVDLWEAEKAWFDTEKLYFGNEFEYRKSYIKLLYITGLITKL